ncbi:tyrosine-type recombinase/integrase [Chryseobacterium luquanense]|uniref:Site-specific integrase n=1 Tax=Chryseobacterium luquanense TaxID=2983766 RepID=A0ABT3XXZ3_9FLAO|nr:site-specific integrase [Chryseobacterium luquanense]MCX8530731.1 site-specific integrase [Chryseobacterium luquanense]
MGKGFTHGTWERYETSLKHTQQFMKWKYNVSDIDLTEINPAFIADYEFFLKTVLNCANNSAVKYIKNFQKIINICLDNEWMIKNPFSNYKSKIVVTDVCFLTETELDRIKNKLFETERLRIVRDIFLFCCFTGLSYSDVKKLANENIVLGSNGEKWINIKRTKTEVEANIPILPIAKEILDNYKKHPRCINDEKVSPVFNYFNSY